MIEDKTMSYTSEPKDMRQRKRYIMDETEINAKLAFANEVKIHDISMGGISLKADRRFNIGKEYLLKLEYKKSEISAKAIVVWSVLSESKADSKGNVIPIYSCGLKFINSSDEQIKQIINLIEKQSRKDNDEKNISLQTEEYIDLSVQFKEELEILNDVS
jgi:Tfp pilus assembly protein PilZ